jgi:hypothetical protein
MSIAILLKRSLPGSKSSIAGHIERGERIAQAIQQRFGISEPRQWQAKHLRWVLERWASEKSEATRYDYWRTVRVSGGRVGEVAGLAASLGRGVVSPRGRGESAEIVQLQFMLNTAMDRQFLAAQWRNLSFHLSPILGIMNPNMGTIALYSAKVGPRRGGRHGITLFITLI